MWFGKLATGAVGGILLSSVGAYAGVTELVTNGSFESPVISGAFQQFTSGIPGWSGSAGIEIQANGALGAGQGTAFGNQYVELGVEAPSTYSQTLATVSGTTYDYSFYLSARPGTGTNTVDVGLTGNASKTFSAADSGSVNFEKFTGTFVATGASSVLSFTPVNLADPGGGDLLDNVSVTTNTGGGSGSTAVPVPPALWTGLMGLSGIAGFGLLRRVRRSAI
jgi:hypothetical protein